MKDIFYKVKKEIKQEYIKDLSERDLLLYFNRIIIDYCDKNDLSFSTDDILEISKKLRSEFRGYGIIDEFILDEDINEIMINSYDTIFIEKKGQIKESSLIFENSETYERIIQKIVSDAGREVNMANPIVGAMMYEGSRVNIVLPPIANKNPVVTIRKFSNKHISMDDLLANGTINDEVYIFLKKVVRAKYNILIGGSTSSGKTTFLNALSAIIDKSERIITIEDSRELSLISKPNLISLETRNANTSKKGSIEIKDLIKNSLRMRPDRIIVGEVRGEECLDMLQAMNTGHEGSLSTVHANSCEDMISRMETMVLRSSNKIPLEAIKKMIGSSIEILLYLKRISSRERKLVEVAELISDDKGVRTNTLYEYDYKKRELIRSKNEFISTEKLERIFIDEK